MNFRILSDFLRGRVNRGIFLSSIEKEMKEYIESNKKSRSSSSVSLNTSDIQSHFSEVDLMYLLTKYLDREILEWELSYILTALDLGSKFGSISVDERCDEICFNLAMPEIPITRENIQSCINFLSGKENRLKLKSKQGFRPATEYRSILFGSS